MKKTGIGIFLIILLTLSLFLLTSCQEEEVYTPVKKTGEEAPPVELPLADPETTEVPGQEEKEVKEVEKEEPKEEPPKEVKKEEPFDDFNKRYIFKALEEEILVRSGPSIDYEIVKYFAKDDEVEIVDKVVGADGEKWYLVRLVDYGLTYGYTIHTNVEFVRESKVDIPETTEGETQTNEE